MKLSWLSCFTDHQKVVKSISRLEIKLDKLFPILSRFHVAQVTANLSARKKKTILRRSLALLAFLSCSLFLLLQPPDRPFMLLCWLVYFSRALPRFRPFKLPSRLFIYKTCPLKQNEIKIFRLKAQTGVA